MYSHPGYFGKLGMRHFHLQRNQYHCPTVNLDKIWAIVSEQTLAKAQASKDKATVIDVTKAVRLYFIMRDCRVSSRSSARVLSLRSPWSSRPRCSPNSLKRESRRPVVLASLLHEHNEGVAPLHCLRQNLDQGDLQEDLIFALCMIIQLLIL